MSGSPVLVRDTDTIRTRKSIILTAMHRFLLHSCFMEVESSVGCWNGTMSMVWTIRGIGILALVAAGLVFARCIADGLHDDYGTGPALAPTAVEQLIQTGSNKNDGSSPLPPLGQD